jgi:large subunit ribosomal protein L25
MATEHKLKAQTRTVTGKKVATLRKQNIVPANIFGLKQSKAIQANEREILSVVKEAGETAVISITVDDAKAVPVMLHEISWDVVSGKPLHVTFQKISLSEKIEANIPVVLVGESQAVKDGGVLVTVIDEIPVKALPTDLPSEFEVSIEQLVALDSEILVGSLSYDKEKVELLIEPDQIIIKIQPPAAEEVEEVPVEAPAEGEAAATESGEPGEAGKAPADQSGDNKPADKAEAK